MIGSVSSHVGFGHEPWNITCYFSNVCIGLKPYPSKYNIVTKDFMITYRCCSERTETCLF